MKPGKMTRNLSILLASILLFAFFTLPVSAESIGELAVPVKMRETVSGSEPSSSRYYTFTLKKTSRVYVKVTVEYSYSKVSVFNSNNKYYVYGSDFDYKENINTGRYSATVKRTLPKGKYYIELYGPMRFSLYVNAEPSISLARGNITSLKSPSAGRVNIKVSKTKNAIGWRIQYSTDYSFKKNVKNLYYGGVTKTITGLKRGKRYYFRVAPYTVYLDGSKIYGLTSLPRSVYVKK